MYGTFYVPFPKREHKKAGTNVPALILGLLNMAVTVDMVFAVTVVPFAPGTVPEFQFRIGDVRSSTNGTAVGVGCGRCGRGCSVGSCIKGDRLCLLRLHTLFPEEPSGIDPPGHGNDIYHILAKEQEIVGKRNDREEIIGEREGNQVHQDDAQID